LQKNINYRYVVTGDAEHAITNLQSTICMYRKIHYQ